jgi:hypothetical protein
LVGAIKSEQRAGGILKMGQRARRRSRDYSGNVSEKGQIPVKPSTCLVRLSFAFPALFLKNCTVVSGWLRIVASGLFART